jgi:hypothetical protein
MSLSNSGLKYVPRINKSKTILLKDVWRENVAAPICLTSKDKAGFQKFARNQDSLR